MNKEQIHKRLSGEQVIAIMENYLAKEINAKEAMANLGLARSQFFNLASRYKKGLENFSISHKGNNGNRKISDEAEEAILAELKSEKELINNGDISIKYYNYSAVRDLLAEKHQVFVSLPTIIARAKGNDYYLKKLEKKYHDREVLTSLIGELAQHDSSHHLWSPYMDKKLYLITTIDDYSRLLMYAELVEAENVWAHIQALKSVFLRYGRSLKYYADQHSIFRYVKDRKQNISSSVWSGLVILKGVNNDLPFLSAFSNLIIGISLVVECTHSVLYLFTNSFKTLLRPSMVLILSLAAVR